MTRKLLLADDNATIQRIVALTFANEDVEVVAVGDGDEAIARIPEERPDIVLATIAMPKRSGYDVAAFVKQTAGLSHVPVLLLAGAFEPVDEARVRRAGGDGVLVKPFEAQHVVARVRELVEKADRARQSSAADGAAGAGSLSSPHAAPGDGPQAVAAPAARELDRYFEQLDAAFATLGNAPPPPSASADADDIIARLTRELDDGEMSVPTIDDILGGASALAAPDPAVPSARLAPPPPEPPDAPATIAAAPAPSATAAPPPAAGPPPAAATEPGADTIADVFRQLLAVEQGERNF